MMKLSYNRIFQKEGLISRVPLKAGEKELPKDVKARVVILSITLKELVDRFEKAAGEALEKLKPQGFDERARTYYLLKKADESPGELTWEEKEKVKEAKKEFDKKAFDKEYKKLDEDYRAFRKEKGEEETEADLKNLSESDFAEILDLMFDCEVDFGNGYKLAGVVFMQEFYREFVK